MSAGTVVVHPNRERPEAKSTKAAVTLLLLASAALIVIVLIGGWGRIVGQKHTSIIWAGVYVIMAYYAWRWSRGTLAMAAGMAIIFAIVVFVGLPGWFSRDKPGFDDPLLPSGLVGLLALVLVFTQVALVVLTMLAFRQKWNVEVEVTEEEAEGGLDLEKFDSSGARREEDEEEEEGRG